MELRQVLVVCRPEVLRVGLARLLAEEGTLLVEEHEQVPGQQRRPAAVAVLCERGLPEPAEWCRELLEGPAARVVVVAGRPDVDSMLECLAAGASAVVTEGDARRDLLTAVHAALRGEDFVAPSSLSLLLDWHRHERRSRPERSRRRELDLLRLLASGRSTAEIATQWASRPRRCATALRCCIAASASGLARRPSGSPRSAGYSTR